MPSDEVFLLIVRDVVWKAVPVIESANGQQRADDGFAVETAKWKEYFLSLLMRNPSNDEPSFLDFLSGKVLFLK